MTKHKIQKKSKAQISNSKTLVLVFVILILNLFCHLDFVIWNSLIFAQDKIIAIVNNDVITQKDLNDFVNFMRMQLSQEFKGKDLETKIQSMKLDLLDRLIEDRLILHEAKKNNSQIEIMPKVWISIAPDESRVKARINEIKKRYDSDAEFQQDLSKQGLTQADIESKIREQLLMYNIIDTKVKDKIVIGPGEVTDFYQENTEKFRTLEQRDFTAITVIDENLAYEIHQNFKNGQKLKDLEDRYPISINKISATRNGQLKKDIEDAVFKLNLGQISEPIKTENSYYILKLDNIISSRQQNLSEVQDSIYAFLFDEKMQEGLNNWLDELKKHSYIKILQD